MTRALSEYSRGRENLSGAAARDVAVVSPNAAGTLSSACRLLSATLPHSHLIKTALPSRYLQSSDAVGHTIVTRSSYDHRMTFALCQRAKSHATSTAVATLRKILSYLDRHLAGMGAYQLP